MEIRRVIAVWFSPTGGTEKVVKQLAERIADHLNVPVVTDSFTLPSERERERVFAKEDLVVFGTPTYAGRVPNKVAPMITELFRGNDTPAVAAVTYGNRSHDDSLRELRDLLEKCRMKTVGACAVVTEHAFAGIGKGRPDGEDMRGMELLCSAVASKVSEAGKSIPHLVIEDDAPVGPYYKPLKEDGSPAMFLKVIPTTYKSRCTDCGICAARCPMGSIMKDDVSRTKGICIKCNACIKRCPEGAKRFEDPDYLSHVEYLRQNHDSYAESVFYY